MFLWLRQWLRDEFSKEDDHSQNFGVIDHLLSLMDPIYDAHCVLLRDIELRLSNWEPPYIGDILNSFCENLTVSIIYFSSVYQLVFAYLITTFHFVFRNFCKLNFTSFFLNQLYEKYIEEHLPILEEISTLFMSNQKFEIMYREFESQKICYLPLTTFILKPIQRLLHYLQILESKITFF